MDGRFYREFDEQSHLGASLFLIHPTGNIERGWNRAVVVASAGCVRYKHLDMDKAPEEGSSSMELGTDNVDHSLRLELGFRTSNSVVYQLLVPEDAQIIDLDLVCWFFFVLGDNRLPETHQIDFR